MHAVKKMFHRRGSLSLQLPSPSSSSSFSILHRFPKPPSPTKHQQPKRLVVSLLSVGTSVQDVLPRTHVPNAVSSVKAPPIWPARELVRRGQIAQQVRGKNPTPCVGADEDASIKAFKTKREHVPRGWKTVYAGKSASERRAREDEIGRTADRLCAPEVKTVLESEGPIVARQFKRHRSASVTPLRWSAQLLEEGVIPPHLQDLVRASRRWMSVDRKKEFAEGLEILAEPDVFESCPLSGDPKRERVLRWLNEVPLGAEPSSAQ